jgi:hypothetical protein
MKLQHYHAKSLLSLTHEGQATGNRICQILTDVDAFKSVKNINLANPAGIGYRANHESLLLHSAIAAVDYAEESATELIQVTSRRKIPVTDEYINLALKAQELGSRLYRNMWEIALSDRDRKAMRQMVSRIAQISVWEDLPAPLCGLSYDEVVNAMTGVIAYNHAFGISFVEYKNGLAATGWTVLRPTLEETVTLARSEMELASALLMPTT